jgi:hypothetical protein
VRNDARRIERPTAGASAISRLGSNAREGYIVAEHLGFSLLLLAIAQATILLFFRLYDIAQIEARRDHPSGPEFTGLPDARRSPARSLAPSRQDSGVIHGRHHLGPITRATIEWYLQSGEARRFQAYFRPEDN